MHNFDALVLGGWAAGLICAIAAGNRGRRVALLDNHVSAAWNNDALAKLEKQVHEWMIRPADTEGYEKAE